MLLSPSRAAVELPAVPLAKQARDQLRLVTMQARLGYVLLGLLGEKRIRTFGFPERSVTETLHAVLGKANIKVN